MASDGSLRFVPAEAAGRHVALRAEMDVLVVLSNTPHPLDPSERYAPRPVELCISRGGEVAADDVCRGSCEQNRRGFQLTEDYNR